MDLIETLTIHRVIHRVDKVPPKHVVMVNAVASPESVTLEWAVPLDSEYAGVKIVRKQGGYPEDLTDGTTVFSGQGAVTSTEAKLEGYATYTRTFTDEGLASTTTYYYRAFAYGAHGNYNRNTTEQQISATTKSSATVYGFAVDETNSDPYKAVTYIESAVGLTPSTNATLLGYKANSWANIYPYNEIRPVVISNEGDVVFELDPSSFDKTTDGRTLSANQRYYTMIEIPPVYWKFTKTTNGYEVRWSDKKVDDSYQALAHERGGVLKGNLYVGAYEGYAYNDTYLRSQTGNAPTTNKSISQFRTYATNIGSGFGLMNFHTMTLLQILFIQQFKTLDSQGDFAQGVRSGNGPMATGGTFAYGMYYGSSFYQGYAMKFMGIENLWGNTETFIDGFVIDTKGQVHLSDNTNFNDTGSGYPYTFTFTQALNGYLTTVMGTQVGAFFPANKIVDNGSYSTHYCDFAFTEYGSANRYLLFGGCYGSETDGGIFRYYVNPKINTSYDDAGARLQYLAP